LTVVNYEVSAIESEELANLKHMKPVDHLNWPAEK
jgi:hypothetical protein